MLNLLINMNIYKMENTIIHNVRLYTYFFFQLAPSRFSCVVKHLTRTKIYTKIMNKSLIHLHLWSTVMFTLFNVDLAVEDMLYMETNHLRQN